MEMNLISLIEIFGVVQIFRIRHIKSIRVVQIFKNVVFCKFFDICSFSRRKSPLSSCGGNMSIEQDRCKVV